MTVSEKLNKLLSERGWTVYRLSQETGLSEATIYKWVNDKSLPKVRVLYGVCEALGITMAEFFAEGNLIEVDDDLRELYSEWQALSKEEREAIRTLIKRKL